MLVFIPIRLDASNCSQAASNPFDGVLERAGFERVALKIEEYALIGDCETAALVGRNGSIDWLCWPDFSSPASFAALIGTKRNGYWLLAPKVPIRKVTRRYRDHTLILESRFETDSGVLLLTDFMPVRETHSDIVRVAQCLHGEMKVKMELCVRFDYGRTVPWTGRREANAWAAAAGTGAVYLRTQQAVRTRDAVATAEFTLHKGEQRSFVLTYARSGQAIGRAGLRCPWAVRMQLARRLWPWMLLFGRLSLYRPAAAFPTSRNPAPAVVGAVGPRWEAAAAASTTLLPSMTRPTAACMYSA